MGGERGDLDKRLKGVSVTGAERFADLAETAFGRRLWDHLTARESVIRMETAVLLGRAPVEALGPGLVHDFGETIRDNRVKQLVGVMVKQIMLSLGYVFVRTGHRITRPGLFTTGALYRAEGLSPAGETRAHETRDAWLREIDKDAFEDWLDKRTTGDDGAPDPARLHRLARKHGVSVHQGNLNPAQLRLVIGAELRAVVPASEVRKS